MNTTLKNILAVVSGALIGGFVNMALIMVSGSIIPPPEGVDITTVEGLKAGIHLFEAKHFIFPFLAHALGTLVGALIAASFAATNKKTYALGIGVLFLIGGVANCFMLPAPMWFMVLDVVLAYLPMGYLGWKLAKK